MFDNIPRFKTLYRKNASQHFAQQPLLDFGNDDDPFETKINNNATTGGQMLGSDQPLFDQIIDLSNEENQNSMTISKTNHILNPTDDTSGGMEENSVIGAPIIAFEDSITASTKSDVPSTAGKVFIGNNLFCFGINYILGKVTNQNQLIYHFSSNFRSSLVIDLLIS